MFKLMKSKLKHLQRKQYAQHNVQLKSRRNKYKFQFSVLKIARIDCLQRKTTAHVLFNRLNGEKMKEKRSSIGLNL